MSKEEEIEDLEQEEVEEKKAKKKAKKSKDSGIVLSMWIFAALVVFILCVTNYQKVKTTMKETQFFEKIKGSETAKPAKEENKPVEKNIAKNDEEIVIDLNAKRKNNPFESVQRNNSVVPEKPVEKTQQTKTTVEPKAEPKSETQTQVKSEPKVTETVKPAEPKPEIAKVEEKPPVPVVKPVEKAVAKLYFVNVSNSGKVSRKYIERSIVKNDSPLTNNLNLLFAGPVGSEKSSAMNLIPSKTKLKGLSIKNGVANINLSEDFEYNSYGMEGYQGALMQIVYTATEFSTVNSVQILIEGQKKEYLGSEGCWIGSPLSRSSF